MARTAKPLPPLAELQRLFEYNPETGELFWKQHFFSCKVGKPVGSAFRDKNTSYLRITSKLGRFLAHRVCWKLATGKDPLGVIDHINGNGLDNRLCNIRDVSPIANSRNLRGLTGVRFRKKVTAGMRPQWNVTLGNDFIGTYFDFFEAVCARKSAEARFW